MKRVAYKEHAVSVFQHAFDYPDLVKEFFELPNIILMNLITDDSWELAVLFGDQILEKIAIIFDPSHYVIENIRFNVRFAKYFHRGRYFAIRNEFAYLTYDQLYKMRLNEYGENDVDTIKIKLITGLILLYIGNIPVASEIIEDVLNKCKEMDAEDLEISTLKSAGRIYLICGLYQEALQKDKTLYEKIKRKFGDNHPFTLGVLNRIGLALLEQNNYTDSLHAFQEICENTKELGNENDIILGAKSNMALTYYKLGQYDESLEIYKEVHAKRFNVYGENHPETLNALSGMGHVYLQQNNFSDALLSFQEICNSKMELGEDQVVLSAMAKIGLIYHALGKYEQSLQMFRKAHVKSIEILGENHPGTLNALNGIGVVLLAQGNYTDCLNVFQQIYENRQQMGDENDVILNAMSNM